VQDPRVSSGSVTYNLVERTFGIYLGPKYFIFPLSRKLVPWASLGIRVQFVDSSFTGTAGNPLGAHDETGTHVAAAATAWARASSPRSSSSSRRPSTTW